MDLKHSLQKNVGEAYTSDINVFLEELGAEA